MKNNFLTAEEAAARIASGAFDRKLMQYYGVSGDALIPYRSRIIRATERFHALFGSRPVRIFSVSGRTELGGNHTDHQNGRVLAAGISADMIAVAAPSGSTEICIHSEGYPEEHISAAETDFVPAEEGTSAALIRGTSARFAQLGSPIQGFVAYICSDIPKGSGMSSSAAYEVLLGTICNDFFADASFSQAESAMIAQYAENVYFRKPCGLMDQMACALGGIVTIDFQDPAAPKWKRIHRDLSQTGYTLCIIDTGADHAGLTAEYAAVPAEMCAVAEMLGKRVLRDTDEYAFLNKLPELRHACGDRAVLRAMHFYSENSRVLKQTEALQTGRIEEYLSLVNESGRSSETLLQNISVSGKPEAQAPAVTLALCQKLLAGKGAYRIHGGGFAGTVQAYVPAGEAEVFRTEMNRMLGNDACHIIQIRACGAGALWEEEEVTE